MAIYDACLNIGHGVRRDGNLYCCYSVPQMKFLKERGVCHEIKALNAKTKCSMWIYIKDENLDKLLKEWSLGSKS